MRRVFLPHEWVNWNLTGFPYAEPGDASGTGLFDGIERRYDAERIARIDQRLARLLPDLIESGEHAGWLTRQGARWIGLPERCGEPAGFDPTWNPVHVASGGGDNMMSAIGAGATRDGVAVLSLGTSATVFARSSVPIVDRGGAIAGAHVDAHRAHGELARRGGRDHEGGGKCEGKRETARSETGERHQVGVYQRSVISR